MSLYKQNFFAYKEDLDLPVEIAMPDVGAVEIALFRVCGSASQDGDIVVEIEVNGVVRFREFAAHRCDINFVNGIYFGIAERPVFRMSGEGVNPPAGTQMAITVYGQIIDRSGAYRDPDGFNKQPGGRPGGFTAPPAQGGYYIDIRTED